MRARTAGGSCSGSKISIGPKDPWGDWMLTIDGKHYDSKGQYYVPVTY